MLRLRFFLIGAVTLIATVGYFAVKNQGTKKDTFLLQEIPIPSKDVKKAPPLETKKEEEEEEEVDLVPRLFTLDSSKLPYVETISYTSRVPWLKDRPAWISDYASHYKTSRHFIARSLNQKRDYFNQKVNPGDRFNVFKKEKEIAFHLFVNLDTNKMKFFLVDQDAKEKILLKTYTVASGRQDSEKKSGSFTPLGTYTLGERIATYKPGTMGIFQGTKLEMIRVFGTRWIPFQSEVADCTETARGFGIHGCPWVEDPNTGELIEDTKKIGSYPSDGCIRLRKEDIEELFAIIITKPTTVELIRETKEVERSDPT